MIKDGLEMAIRKIRTEGDDILEKDLEKLHHLMTGFILFLMTCMRLW